MIAYHSGETSRMRGRGTGASLARVLRRPVTYLLAGLILAAGVFFTGLPSASAYDCPPGRDCHFVRISTHGLPAWKANMRMYNQETGETLYTWKESHGHNANGRTGGHASWWWNIDPEDTTTQLQVKINSTNFGAGDLFTDGPGDGALPDSKISMVLNPRYDHCFLVKGGGELLHTNSGFHDEKGVWQGRLDGAKAPCTDD